MKKHIARIVDKGDYIIVRVGRKYFRYKMIITKQGRIPRFDMEEEITKEEALAEGL